MSWFVGEVITFVVHVHHGTVYHLAVVPLVNNSAMGNFGIPIIEVFANNEDRKVIVCDVSDIITLAGFVRYNDSDCQYKVIWENALYYRKLDGRSCGRRRDL